MRRFHANGLMRAFILCIVTSFASAGQEEFDRSARLSMSADRQNASRRQAPDTLSADDGLSIIAAALDSRIQLSKRDCSHLIHAVYVRAGFPYSYARSSDLYVGTDDFQRVTRPQPGDLVVWRGHVGIVVNPAQHIFFSAMRSGPGIDGYDAPYWKHRGHVRFYRYIKQNATNSRNRLTPTRQDE
jgi:cell wall-associated NlpC family hydrolase